MPKNPPKKPVMTSRLINKIVRSVCNAEVRCPVFDAYSANCSACGPEDHCFERDECPLRHALQIFADIERGKIKVEN